MLLENISLVNFKNYNSLKLTFSKEVNCFVGNNGAGKTNILDAIFYLSMTKSAFNSIDQQNISHNEQFFSVQGAILKGEEKYNIHCSLKTGQKKIFKRNKKIYDKISEHIGEFPVVLIAPNDTDLIREGSETRRKFFDSILAQIDQEYLRSLLQYNHVLKQRNGLLKQFADRHYFDKDILEPYDHQIINLGEKIFLKRKEFMTEFNPGFSQHFDFLSSKKELTELRYTSDLFSPDFRKLFKNNLKKDLALQRTTMGIHKDDFEFTIEGNPLKKFGSQGQQKSFIIALKLAHFDVIKKVKGFKPLLLLDDIFDKLDELRIEKLMTMVAGNSFGQIFVTDARPERTREMFKKVNSEIFVFVIEDGNLVGEDFERTGGNDG